MTVPLNLNEPDLPGKTSAPDMTGGAFGPAGIEPRRSAWVSALKSLVLPGLGQWHNGEVDKAAWLLSGFALCSVPGVAVVALWLPSALMLPALLLLLAATLTLWVGGVVDAWRVARRGHDDWWPGRGVSIGPQAPVLWRQPGITLLILLLCDGVALPLLTHAVRQNAVASFRIPSASMAPVLWPGDIVFTDRRYACIGCAAPVRRGDVAVFAYPDDRTQYYVKRVIGLPGDRVRVAGAQVWVNGELVPAVDAPMPPAVALAQAVMPPGAARPVPADAPESTVPPGHVFVLGDDRARSVDSRQFGGVPLADVVGRVRQIWWSSGPDGVRWSRLGRVVQ
jgi:signal peptidase I